MTTTPEQIKAFIDHITGHCYIDHVGDGNYIIDGVIDVGKAIEAANATAPAVAVKHPSGSRMQGMVRSIDQYRNGDPKVIMAGSEAQALYALQDARHDILILWDIAFAALSAQVQNAPEGWTRHPERYTNYPHVVELEPDGWHLRDLRRLGIYREVSTHATAIDAMKAIEKISDFPNT